MDKFYYNIGNRIWEKRVERCLTREKMADMADISDKFLYDIEVGNKGMSAKTLYNIAVALNVTTDWILKGNDSE